MYDCFGKVLIEINKRLNMNIYDNVIYISVGKRTETVWRFYLQEQTMRDIQLLDFNMEMIGYTDVILWLKQKAIDELCFNPLQRFTNSKMNVHNLKEFFKLVKLRKHYLSDYLYLVKNIFGIKVSNNTLVSYPYRFIKEDYVIKYKFKDEEYTVNFSSNLSNEKKTLYGVGHKIGGKDKFVYTLKSY